MTTRTYFVPGISCDHCKHAIETEVTKLIAVTHVEVDIGARTVKVDGGTSDADVRAAIDKAGYDSEGEALSS
jgi:copper chaperone